MEAKVFVGNLSSNTTEETLRQAFSEFGHVIAITVLRDRETGQSRGFGFVTFENSHVAQAAINGMDDRELDGNRLKVHPANSRGGHTGSGSSYGNYYGNYY